MVSFLLPTCIDVEVFRANSRIGAIMNLEEAIRLGFVDDDERLSKIPDIEPDGRAIVPYGVRSLAEDCISYQSEIEYLLLPDTLEEMEPKAIHDVRSLKSVVTYSENDDPRDIETIDGVCDLRSVRRFVEFPSMKSSLSREPLFEKVIISAEAEIQSTRCGCDGPIAVVGDGEANISVDGILYTDGGETLGLFPPTKKTVKKYRIPDTVKQIAPFAFKAANINTVVLNSNVKEVCPRAFEFAHVQNVIIPSGAISFSHKTERKRGWSGGTVETRYGAFSNCYDLKSVKLPDGITVINENMFYDCKFHFSEIAFPESVSSISKEAFGGCAKLSSIIPETVQSVAPGAFRGTKSVILPNSCASAFEKHLSASNGTVVAIAGPEGSDCVRAGYTPPKGNLAGAVASELESGIAFDAIDACFRNGGIKKFEDKIRVAITRLVDSRHGHPISDEMEAVYAAYVKKNAKKAAKAFAEEGDVVCSRLLSELGFGSAALAQMVKNDATKPKKASAAQLAKAAIEAMRKGDASKLSDVKPVASRVAPTNAMKLLKYGAIKGDAEVIDQLYEMFGGFEMPSIALSRAIAHGNTDTALALARHGATLSDQIDQKMAKGKDRTKVRASRWKYLNSLLSGEDALDIPGRSGCRGKLDECPGYIYLMTLSKDSDPVIEALAERGLLRATDLKGLLLASLAESDEIYLCTRPKTSLAATLAKYGALNDDEVTLCVQRGMQGHYADIHELSDVLFPRCSPNVVKTVAKLDPNAVGIAWDKSFLNGDIETLKTMVPYLSLQYVGSATSLINALAKNGCVDELKIISEWDGAFNEKNIETSLAYASKNGHTETTAFLVALNAELFGRGVDDCSLML